MKRSSSAPDTGRYSTTAIVLHWVLGLVLIGLFGLGALAAMASTYHPLGVASYTTVNDRTVSWGAFGMVFFIQPSSDK